MTYAAAETSVHGARPVELYRFAQGSLIWAHAASDVAIAYGGDTYAPVPIGRREIELSDDLARAGLELEVARDHPVAVRFIPGAPGGVIGLTVFRYHLGDGETIAIWKGRVAACEFAGIAAKLTCEPIFTSLQRPGLRAMYQRLCRHAHYDSGCTLSPGAFTDFATVNAIAGAAITVSATGRPDGWYTAGYLALGDTDRRLIRAHAGSVVTLLSALPALKVGDAVRLVAGCDHQLSTCTAKFANQANFGGFPYIPTKNPFAGDGIA